MTPARLCRIRSMAAVALLLSATAGIAEIRVMVRFEHSDFLVNEDVHALVALYNGQDVPLRICGEKDKGCAQLTFLIEPTANEWLKKHRKGPIIKGIDIDPGRDREMVVELTRWYNLATEGRYMVRAVLHKDGKMITSPKTVVEIVPGIELKKTSRSVAGYDELIRTYSLRYWKRGRLEVLFLSIDEEPTGINYGVFELGPLLRVQAPSLSVSRKGRVEIRHQRSADCFVRTKLQSGRHRVEFVDQRFELPSGEPYPNVKSRLAVPLPSLPGE